MNSTAPPPIAIQGINFNDTLTELVKKVISEESGNVEPVKPKPLPVSNNVTAIEYGMIGVLMGGIIAAALVLKIEIPKVPNLPNGIALRIVNNKSGDYIDALQCSNEEVAAFIKAAYPKS